MTNQIARFESLSKPWQLAVRFHLLLGADVTNAADDQHIAGHLYDAEADLDRELGRVFAPSHEFAAYTHRPGVGIGHVPCPVLLMDAMHACGQQDLHRLAEQFVGRISE